MSDFSLYKHGIKTLMVSPTGDAAAAINGNFTTIADSFDAVLSFRGSWSSTSSYALNDVVVVGSTIYVAVASSTNQTPPNATYWTALSAPQAATPTLEQVTAAGASTDHAVTFSGGITGNVTGNVSGTASTITGNIIQPQVTGLAATLAGYLTLGGNGSALTNLNASAIASGTLNASRLPDLSHTALSFGPLTINGNVNSASLNVSGNASVSGTLSAIYLSLTNGATCPNAGGSYTFSSVAGVYDDLQGGVNILDVYGASFNFNANLYGFSSNGQAIQSLGGTITSGGGDIDTEGGQMFTNNINNYGEGIQIGDVWGWNDGNVLGIGAAGASLNCPLNVAGTATISNEGMTFGASLFTNNGRFNLYESSGHQYGWGISSSSLDQYVDGAAVAHYTPSLNTFVHPLALPANGGLRLFGNGYAGGDSGTGSISLYLNFNASGNRQFAIADTADIGSATNAIFRFGVGSPMASIGACTGDGANFAAINLGVPDQGHTDPRQNIAIGMGYYSSNFGTGTTLPASKLTVNGNLAVGYNYVGTAAPASGAIIQGAVGIGMTSPNGMLGVASPGTGTYQVVADFLAPSNVISGHNTQLHFGTSLAAANCAEWQFCWMGDGSTSNHVDLSFYGKTPSISYTAGGLVGIGTTSPVSKLHVTGGDVEVNDIASGIILHSASHRWRITVNDSGVISATSI